MTPTRRLATVASLAFLALLALPLASAQHGPPPGYTDPLVYAQDYVTGQAGQAQADPVGYASHKATPDNLSAEADHTAWLACWTAYEAGQMALDPVCSQFFVAPGVVDAPAEAQATISSVTNGTGADALLAESLDAVGDTVADPSSAPSQVQRIVDAVVAFVTSASGFVVDLVHSLIDPILKGLGLGKDASVAGLRALGDGLLAAVGLPILGMKAASSGLVGAVSGAASGIAAAGLALVDGVQAAGSAVAAAALAVAGSIGSGFGAAGSGLASLGSAVAGAGSSVVSGVGDAAGAVQHGVSDVAHAVRDTVSGWFGHDGSSSSSGDDLLGGQGDDVGHKADGLVDKILGLL